MNQLRRTGRTTRMLLEAKRLAESGRAVYVLSYSFQHANQLREQFEKLSEEDLGVKFESYLPNFNWENLKLYGAHPNCVVLVDHYAIERRYENILSMLHAFDEDRSVTYCDWL